MRHIVLSAAVVLLGLGASASAGDVKIEGVHLCCGGCVKQATALFQGKEGITNLKIDKDAGTVSYTAADEKAAQAGLDALAKAGWYGKGKHGDAALKSPTVTTDAKGDSVTIKGAHNCCGMCVKAISAALKAVDGVSEVKCEKDTCTITGKAVSHKALIEALHAEGLHGTVGG